MTHLLFWNWDVSIISYYLRIAIAFPSILRKI
jgi:hypothetical protein